jgi:universal stress protein A
VLEIRKILVPIDFSDHSQSALDDAVELARKFGAELHVLHCYPLYPIGGGSPYDLPPPPGFDRVIREPAKQQLSEWAGKARTNKVRVQEHLSANVPSEGIAELAKSLGADLIVMGTRGLSGLKHVVLGSVAERTVRIAPCPVMTVKHGAVH